VRLTVHGTFGQDLVTAEHDVLDAFEEQFAFGRGHGAFAFLFWNGGQLPRVAQGAMGGTVVELPGAAALIHDLQPGPVFIELQLHVNLAGGDPARPRPLLCALQAIYR
jgi:hypothetical protein